MHTSLVPAVPAVPARPRADRCPGVLRPWAASDGGLVRIRVPGGRVSAATLVALGAVAQEYGDGRVRVTRRANLQLRALPLVDGSLPAEVLAAVEATGLLPSREHDLVRNVLASPQTGLAGGRADLRPVVAAWDRLVLASAGLAALPGRFLVTLDDGRGDLADRHRDLGLVALDHARAQLRVGDAWGPVVALVDAPAALAGFAREFLRRRGAGPTAAWHVTELIEPLVTGTPAAPGADVRSGALAFGPVPGGEHVAVGDDGVDAATLGQWARRSTEVVVTPWRGVLVPQEVVA